MKKMIAAAVVAALTITAAFADQVMHALDISVPIENRTLKTNDDDYDEVDIKSTGFNFNYDRMAVGNSGFSFIFGVGMGYNSVNIDLDAFDVDIDAFDLRLKLGWGGSPIHNNKMLLSIHGYTGFDFKAGTGTKDDLDFTLLDYSMPLGIDVVFAAKLSGSFGLTAGLDISTNLFSVGTLFYDYEDEQPYYTTDGYEYRTYTDSDQNFMYSVFNGITTTPRIGICWIL